MVVKHAIWADNIFILAANREQLEIMLRELGQAIQDVHLTWKSSSLAYLSCGRVPQQSGDICINLARSIVLCPQVESLEVFGDLLDNRGDSFASWDHRKHKADGKFYASQGLLRSRGSLGERLGAWVRAPGKSATFGCETWHLTQGLLENVQTWRLGKLRYMLKMKRKDGVEGLMQYNQRTDDRIRTWFHRFKLFPIHVRIIKAVFKAVWKEPRTIVGLSSRPLQGLRLVRSAIWWAGIQDLPVKRRRAGGCVQDSSGHIPAWEDCFVLVYGLDWRSFSDQLLPGMCDANSSLASWMVNWTASCEHLCAAWQLPFQCAGHCGDPLIPIGTGITYALECAPMPKVPPWCVNFAAPFKRISVLVDCQTAAKRLLRPSVTSLLQIPPTHVEARLVATARFRGLRGMGPNVAFNERGQYRWTEEATSGATNLLAMSDGGFKNEEGAIA